MSCRKSSDNIESPRLLIYKEPSCIDPPSYHPQLILIFSERLGPSAVRGKSYTGKISHKGGDTVQPLFCSPVIIS